MLFKPENSKLWDTFIFPHEGKYYLFYLQLNKRLWDGYGLAISDDLVHWKDMGNVLYSEVGTATGMVYKTDSGFILNFCHSDGDRNKVCFARSDDLIHWERLPDSTDFFPDERWYDVHPSESDTNARWGDMWVERQEDGSYLSFLTATDKSGPVGANGAAGMGISKDGINWTALPPVSVNCGMGWMEVGCHVSFGGRHYLLVGSNSGLGARFDPVYNSAGKAGGMYVMVSDDIRGPYRLVEGDPLLLGCRNAPPNWAYIPVYYTRALRVGDDVLLNHHWLPREDFIDAWLGTVKVLKEGAPGRLALYYWPGNESLKGEKVFDSREDRPFFTPYPQAHMTGEWTYKDGVITGKTAVTSLLYFETEDIFESGTVIEADISVDGNGAGGLLFGIDNHSENKPFEGDACLVNTRGFVEFGSVTSGVCGPVFMIENSVPSSVVSGESVHIKILLRGEFVEVYAGDRLAQCYGFSKKAVRSIGVFAERAQVRVKDLRIYRFSL